MDILPIITGGIVANCYLVKTEKGFILIDTGRPSMIKRLEKELNSAGCKPGNLNLIVLTHGDFDHTGNCAYLREKYRVPIAIHHDDSGMVENGDMFWNRVTGNKFAKKIVNILFAIKKFKPDVVVNEGYSLLEYGVDATIIHLPGHSKGSIGIYLSEGALVCGDLFVNYKKPVLNTILDNAEDAHKSVEKIKSMNIKTIYPGHGKPFTINVSDILNKIVI